jgi:uncharacterized protein RhaS with RHS repeats
MTYNPLLGRWMEEDPLGFEAGDINLYRYVSNDPTSMVDPMGTTGSMYNWKIVNYMGQRVGAILYELPPEVLWDNTSWNSDSISEAAFAFGHEARTNWKEYLHPGRVLTPKEAQEAPERIENAARHAYWQAMLTAKYGDVIATKVGYLHELGNWSIDSLTDTYNNEVARRLIGVQYYEMVNEIEKQEGHTPLRQEPGVSGWRADPNHLSVFYHQDLHVSDTIREKVKRDIKDLMRRDYFIISWTDCRLREQQGYDPNMP